MTNRVNLYKERVLPTTVAMLPLILLLPTAYFTLLPFSATAGLLLGPLFALAILVSAYFAAPVIEVSNESIAVGDIEVPLEYVSGVTVVKAEDGFAERGVRLSPAAYTRFQMGVKTMVKIELSDPNDKTPYWLIASKNPQGVVAAFEAAKN